MANAIVRRSLGALYRVSRGYAKSVEFAKENKGGKISRWNTNKKWNLLKLNFCCLRLKCESSTTAASTVAKPKIPIKYFVKSFRES